jgi:hypothetical protein
MVEAYGIDGIDINRLAFPTVGDVGAIGNGINLSDGIIGNPK